METLRQVATYQYALDRNPSVLSSALRVMLRIAVKNYSLAHVCSEVEALDVILRQFEEETEK